MLPYRDDLYQPDGDLPYGSIDYDVIDDRIDQQRNAS